MSSERVLIVEDHPGIRKSLRWNLQVAGYNVAEASNGMEALEIVRNEPPEVMLLDLSMPVMNGLVVLAEMNEMRPRPGTRIIVMTAHRSTPLVVEAMRLGASDFLVKPVHPRDVQNCIASMIAGLTSLACP
jgi:DNA-binding NtrC family response regulator